jgi:hypothetical protein
MGFKILEWDECLDKVSRIELLRRSGGQKKIRLVVEKFPDLI